MKKYTLIIIENDTDERFFMKEGFDEAAVFDLLVQLENGNALLDWLTAHPTVVPDLIVSDLNMPGKNGYDVISELKASEAYASVPVVIISTSSTPSIISKCLTMGAAAYLVKPDTFMEYASFARDLYQLALQKGLVKKD